jgi:hypothetical protein
LDPTARPSDQQEQRNLETHSKPVQPEARRKLLPYVISFLAGAVALASVLGGYAWEYRSVGKDVLQFAARSFGYDAFGIKGASKAAVLRAAPGNYFREIEIPQIVLDIKFEHWEKIVAKRAKAIANGGLVQEEDDFVPATVRYSDGTTNSTAKTKLRLKGDQLDHLLGEKWSFRVKTRNKDHVWGMRRFSLQKAETRDFQLTPMMLALTESLGIVSPRYFFANLVINGKKIGIMAVEEHPAKELLEASGRKESVIIRFSEKYYWYALSKNIAETDDFKPFKDYRFAPIDAFQSSRIAKSATLAGHHRVAAGLMRGFADGRLPASRVFDAELMGRFMAVIELFGARHGAIWHNMRFYFNPQTSLLEPIPFDMTTSAAWGSMVVDKEPILRAILADEKIARAFRTNLKSLISRVRSGELIKLLEKAEARHLPRLQKEYVLHGRYPLGRVVKRAVMLKREMFESGGRKPVRYDHILFAREYMDGPDRVLTLLNTLTRPVTVTRVHVADCKGAGPGRAEAIAHDRMPVTVPAARPGSRPEGVRLELKEGLGNNCTLIVDARLADGDKIRTISVDRDAVPLDKSPIPASTIAAQLAGRGFLSHDGAAKELRVAAGHHAVRRDLIVPADTTLVIGRGTTLRFAPDAAVIAHGPVRIEGTDESPVVLAPIDAKKGWQGIAVVRAGARSRVAHARVIHTTSVVKPGWALTGGVTFYESDVDIEATTLSGHRGEDALNIVRSAFVIHDTTITDTLSDAFDSDFSTGRITKSRFTDIGIAGGGDAVDTSGSTVEIAGATFKRVSDKAISVGEASTVTVKDVTIEDIGTGLASKDRSRLEASGISIRGAKFAALTAYIKKPEYGGATIIADDITIDGAERDSLVQFGSRIVMAGKDVAAQDIDIDALYDTVMKPGAR